MTQESRHQAAHIDSYPFPSDPGPYTGDQWALRERTIFTGDQYATQGPLVRYLNELEVTDNDATTDDEVYVDTGAAFVNGHWFHSDEQETFSIPAGPVGGRIDRVVVVENNTNATITAPAAAPALTMLLPNDLSEYDQATPGIPAYSARLAIVRGADTGALPGIDQGTTVYMVELYRYTIDNGPEFSSQADQREFCLFSSTIGERQFIAIAVAGDNYPYSTVTGAGGAQGVELATGVVDGASGIFVVPSDYKSSLVVQAIYLAWSGAGNIRVDNAVYYGGCTESYTVHTHAPASVVIAAVTTATNTCVCDLTLTNASAGDIVHVTFTRSGGGPDTYASSIWLICWLITYEAKS